MTSLQEAFMDYATDKKGSEVSREEATDIAMSDLTEEVNNTLIDNLYPGWKEASTVIEKLEEMGLARTRDEAKSYISQMMLLSHNEGGKPLNISFYSNDDNTYFRFKR